MNIGKPFNTRKDDMGFVISGRGEAAYFIRDLDIYYADLRGKKKSLKPDPSVLVYGKIMFNDTPVQKPVRIVSEGLILGTTYSDEYGRYSINVPSGFSIADVFVEGAEEQYQHYKITSKSKRYEEFKVDFFAFHKSQDEKDTTIEVPSSELEHLSTMIYFEFDEFDLSFDELIKLKNLIQSINQSSVIYIVGHTDHTGTERYNLDLSRKRAIAVQDFIIEFTGLNKNQIIMRFEGERNTLNKGDTLEERSLNRRVSVKIMNH
jgi:outer membrane protein OmpA-like peptidoglycan-associated protein